MTFQLLLPTTAGFPRQAGRVGGASCQLYVIKKTLAEERWIKRLQTRTDYI